MYKWLERKRSEKQASKFIDTYFFEHFRRNTHRFQSRYIIIVGQI